MPYVVGGNEVYQQQTSWPLILEHSEVVVLWSANPLNTLKIAWNASDEQGIPWFDRLRQSGKRLICIDLCDRKALISLANRWNGSRRIWALTLR